jgi:hypothetical protein
MTYLQKVWLLEAMSYERELMERAQNQGRPDNDSAAIRERLRQKLKEKRERGNSSRADNQGER